MNYYLLNTSMKILKMDLKNLITKVKIDNLDDIWILSRIISKDDVVGAKTTRIVKKEEICKKVGCPSGPRECAEVEAGITIFVGEVKIKVFCYEPESKF